jgi:hypothetical protein
MVDEEKEAVYAAIVLETWFKKLNLCYGLMF